MDVAYTIDGQQQVTEIVDRNGNLTQFDSAGAHKLASGVRSASVAFGTSGEIMVLVNQVGQLIQVDTKGAHLLASGVMSADVALSGGQEVLEVVFLASGQVQVIGIVSGLGHGLDEAAIQAAKMIRFRPAQRNGQPVDYHAHVRIEFRFAG